MRDVPTAIGSFVDLEPRDLGSIGSVFDGHDSRTGRRVTIELFGSVARAQAYRRKLATAASLDHPNIAQVVDAGASGDSLYVVYDHLEGEPLARRLERRQTSSARDRLELLAQAAAGLAHAHSLGVPHSQLSPRHLWLDAGGRVTITGLARPRPTARDLDGAYLAPEQARDQDAGPATDVYAFAVLAYELLSSRHPFGSGGGARDRQPAPLEEAWRGCPRELSELIGRCLSPSPAARPGLDELAEGLRTAQSRLDGPPQRDAESRATAAGGEPTSRRYPPWLAAVAPLALVLLAVAGVQIYRFMQPADSALQTPPPPPPPREDPLAGLSAEERDRLWEAVEPSLAPAVARVRCRYHFQRAPAGRPAGSLELTGSAISIDRGLLLTSRSAVEPWQRAVDWQGTGGISGWSQFAESHRLTPVYESLEVQFPGHPPAAASLLAVSPTSDLALLRAPGTQQPPIPVAAPDRAAGLAHEVAIAGYPSELEERPLALFDRGSTAPQPIPPARAEFRFRRTTVIRPAGGETVGYFHLGATVAPGSGGGPVVNFKGEVVGIVSSPLAAGEPIVLDGVAYDTMREARAPARAVDLAEIVDLLSRAGVL